MGIAIGVFEADIKAVTVIKHAPFDGYTQKRIGGVEKLESH